jgi:hypothetical protein
MIYVDVYITTGMLCFTSFIDIPKVLLVKNFTIVIPDDVFSPNTKARILSFISE